MNSATRESNRTAPDTMPAQEKIERDAYQEALDWFERRSGGDQPSWLLPLRKAGLARFAELGYPSLRDEDWRFTNVEPITRLPFRPVLEPLPDEAREITPAELPLAHLDAIRMVFVNGHFAPRLSDTSSTAKGVTIAPLSSAWVKHSEWICRHLAQQADRDNDPFGALNSALFTDGMMVHVPAGVVVGRPIHLVHVTTAKAKGSFIHPRHLMVAERGSRLTVLETHASSSAGPVVNNVVTELVVGDEAVVEHVKLQDDPVSAYHLAAVHARLGRASRFWHHSFAMGAKLSRNNIRTRLEGDHLECVLNGLYLTRGDQLADHHMIVNHVSPHCASHEYFNGILSDKSRGVFHGRILVQQAAQKTDAKQTNKNLLLSDDATANTKPQLEIYADDVKCTHGATIGQLDQESIFYLRARGIGKETARRMLIHAFAGEIIERIQSEPIREALDRLVWNRLEEHKQIAMNP